MKTNLLTFIKLSYLLLGIIFFIGCDNNNPMPPVDDIGGSSSSMSSEASSSSSISSSSSSSEASSSSSSISSSSSSSISSSSSSSSSSSEPAIETLSDKLSQYTSLKMRAEVSEPSDDWHFYQTLYFDLYFTNDNVYIGVTNTRGSVGSSNYAVALIKTDSPTNSDLKYTNDIWVMYPKVDPSFDFITIFYNTNTDILTGKFDYTPIFNNGYYFFEIEGVE